ncbi:hypothetical protein SKC41_10815 [Mycobacterium sp. 050128]|uniref:hypothetical protein n=1 Tax=Mycobacterium sp. 050128 TaxID=3096112 RepID=UPI002ED96990
MAAIHNDLARILQRPSHFHQLVGGTGRIPDGGGNGSAHIDGDDVRTFVGKPKGMRTSLPAGRSPYERDPALIGTNRRAPTHG